MTSTEPDEAHPAPWWRRVVPVTAAVLALGVVACLLSPGLRHQLALTASHQRASYVELYFTPASDGTIQPCRTSGRTAAVAFDLAAHGDATRSVGWTVTFSDPAGARPERTLSGTSRLTPGRVTRVERDQPLGWHGPYGVTVEVTGTTDRLLAHCGAES